MNEALVELSVDFFLAEMAFFQALMAGLGFFVGFETLGRIVGEYSGLDEGSGDISAAISAVVALSTQTFEFVCFLALRASESDVADGACFFGKFRVRLSAVTVEA